MLFLLRVAGYEILPDPDGADLVIINTCGFIEDAKAEAIDNILAMGEMKKEGRIGKILVTGCLAQRYQMEIVQEMPEVDGVLGTGSYYDIVSAVGKVLAGELVSEFGDINAPQPEPQRILTTPEHYAYLRIAEGCDNHCAFCIIPQLRGRYRSRPMEELLKEAQDLADSHCAGHEPLRHRSVRRAEAGGAAAEALRHRRLCLGACTLSLSGRNV